MQPIYYKLFFYSFFLSFIVTPLIRYLALKFNFVSYPKEDRWHKKPTAIFGGVAIFIAAVIPLFFIADFGNRQFSGFILGVFIMFICGVIDDIKKLAPQVKILFQIVASCVIIYFGISIKINPSYLSNLPDVAARLIDLLVIPLTILWIVGITNAFNLLDNMDGLAAGIAAISSLMLFFSGIFIGSVNIPIVAIVLAGASFGFLPYNFNPAKIFMGDSGSMFLGFCLSSVALMGTGARTFSNLLVTLAVPLLILVVPIFDTALVTLMRSFNGKSILKGGKDHTSHRLVALGLSEKKTVLILYLISILFGVIALAYSKLDALVVSILAILTLIVLLFFGKFLCEVKSYTANEGANAARNGKIKEEKVILNTIILYKGKVLEILVDFLLICISYYSAYLLRFEGVISDHNYYLLRTTLPWIIVIKLVCFYYFNLYGGIWHFTGMSDFVSVLKAVTIGSVLSTLYITFADRFKDHSRVIVILDWMLTVFFITFARFIYRFLQEYFYGYKQGKRILIFGAGACGELFLREIKYNKVLNYKPIGFIDDDKKKSGKAIHGLKILGTRKDLGRFIKEGNIEEVIITVPSLSKESCSDILETCSRFNIPCRSIAKIMDIERWA